MGGSYSYRFHSVDVGYGTVESDDGRVPTVRLLFHPGGGLDMNEHPEIFIDPAALPGLILQLQFIERALSEGNLEARRVEVEDQLRDWWHQRWPEADVIDLPPT